MIEFAGIDLKKLASEAESQTGKAAETQVRNWIKGLMFDEANLRIKAIRLREEADATDAKAAEKKSQLDRVRGGDWSAVKIDEIRGGDEKKPDDKK